MTAPIDPIHAFYCRKEYLDLAVACKVRSGGVCEGCGAICDVSDLRPHHIVELTVDNVNDPSIALNPQNIRVLCHNCHNKIHGRAFGNKAEKKPQKRVYLVTGSPMAGKSTYVEQAATRDDLIVDLDRIHRAICVCNLHDKPDATKRTAFRIRDLLYDEIRTATPYRKWDDAYIIATMPERIDREGLAEKLSASVIHVDTPKDECIRRCLESDHPAEIKTKILSWIRDYWERFTT